MSNASATALISVFSVGVTRISIDSDFVSCLSSSRSRPRHNARLLPATCLRAFVSTRRLEAVVVAWVSHVRDTQTSTASPNAFPAPFVLPRMPISFSRRFDAFLVF